MNSQSHFNSRSTWNLWKLAKWFHSYSLLSNSLLLCGLFYEAICCMSYHVSFCSCIFFSPFSIAITSLVEERANLSAFRTFVRFVLVWICRFPLPLGVWEGLRFVIVALPGFFSYLFSEEKLLYNIMIYTCTQHRDREKNVEKFITVLGSYIIKRKHNT